MAKKDKNDTDIALLQKDITYIKGSVDDVKNFMESQGKIQQKHAEFIASQRVYNWINGILLTTNIGFLVSISLKIFFKN